MSVVGVTRAVASDRPNVLVFVSDDQTRRTVTPEVMPAVYHYMVSQGVSYPNFTDADPLCCPSRASIMSGRYNHNNHVLTNDEANALSLDLRSTIQCYLHTAGYRTGFYGKFLNGFPILSNHPCLTDYAINRGQQHAGLPVSVNGTLARPSGWVDEFGLRRAKRFLKRVAPKQAPWYVYFSDSYPHSPYVPRPKYAEETITPPPGTEGPALNEADVTDKPAFIQAHFGDIPNPNQTLENELRMLRTVDDHFAALITKLRELHQLRTTLIIYVSDNGYLFGEHGLWGKSVPYFEAINVPMMIRFPGRRSAGTVDRRHAQNIDLAPTIRAATGIHPTLIYTYDGRSLLSQWRRPVMLNESFHVGAFTARNWQPSWRSITTAAYQYVEWRQDGNIIAREYYDRATDPSQLHNLLGDSSPANDPDVTSLHIELRGWALCAGQTCH